MAEEVTCAICGRKWPRNLTKVRHIGPLTFCACIDCLERLEDWLDD